MPILYLDHNRIPAPLSCSYHATGSRHLTSIRSVACEVDSTYCPQCFSYDDAYTTTKSKGEWQGRCIRPHCKACPVCIIPLQVSVEPSPFSTTPQQNICLYKCGYCGYSSIECGVYAHVHGIASNSGDEPAALKAMVEELEEVYQKRIQDVNYKPQKLFDSLVEAWNQKEQEFIRIQKLRKSCDQGVAFLRATTRSNIASNSWNMETLERRNAKCSTEQLLSSYISNVLAVNGTASSSLLEAATTSQEEDQISKNITASAIASINSRVQQTVILASLASITQQPLLPLRIPMLPKMTKRCKLELAKGKPGILVKTKINPLEGDTTSSRTGHGQWWKKDCSAIHDVPRLDLVKYGSSPSSSSSVIYCFLLRFHNPMLSPVQVRFNAHSANDDPAVFEDVVLDAYDTHKQSEKVHVMKCGRGITTWIEVDASQTVELLEIYTGTTKTSNSEQEWKANIKQWDAKQSMQDFLTLLNTDQQQKQADAVDYNGDNDDVFRVLGIDKDTAWIEWTTQAKPEAVTTDKPFYRAIPLAMQVLSSSYGFVGKSSSTQSDRQQQQQDGGEQNDFLTFDTLVVWECTDR